MTPKIIVSLLFATTLTGIQSMSLNSALSNDLDETCIKSKGHDAESALNSIFQCWHDGSDGLEDEIRILCKTNTFRECLEKFKGIVLPCLPEDTHQVINQVAYVVNQRIKSYCINNGEYYRIISNNTCEFASFREKIKNCTENVDFEPESAHLKDYFSDENCEKMKEYIECQNSAVVVCPKLQKAMSEGNKAVLAAYPCNNAPNCNFSLLTLLFTLILQFSFLFYSKNT